MMLELWKKQFSKDRILMRHDEPHVFMKSQWQTKSGPSIFYTTYRWLFTIFVFGTWLLSVIDPKHLDESIHFRAKWTIYLTNWGYSLCFLQSLICSVCVTVWCVTTRKSKDPASEKSVWTTGPYKLYWILNVIATDIAFGITILYWALIYDEMKMEVDAQNIFVHATNSAIMLFDLFVVAHPLHLVQCYWPVLFGVVYIVFSVIYHVSGGTSRNEDPYIYPVLDWGKPGKTTVVCLLVLVFLVFLHVFSCCVQLLRTYLERTVRRKKSSADVTRHQTEKGFDNIALSNDIA